MNVNGDALAEIDQRHTRLCHQLKFLMTQIDSLQQEVKEYCRLKDFLYSI